MLDLQGIRALRLDIARMYRDGDRESARLRGMHLAQVMRLTPHTMLANLFSAAVIGWTFSTQAPTGLGLWLLALLTVCCLALWTWHRQRHRSIDSASPRAVHRATVHAAALGGLWAMMPVLWFAGANTGQRMVVATLITGMLGAGSFVLSPLPHASLVWVLMFSLAAWAALWQAGDPALAGVAVLVFLYAPVVAAGSVAAWRKATALIRAQAQAARQEQMLAVLLQDFEQQAGEALWETGIDGRLKHVSARLAELLHSSPAALMAQPFVQLIEQHGAESGNALRHALDGGRPFTNLPLTLALQTGTVHLSIKGKHVMDETGHLAGWRGVLADITAKVNDERLLWQLAHTDTLTGLANRFSLRDALSQALQRGQPLALVLIDLDHFKSINDSHGHSAGDEVLQGVARCLTAHVRAGDVVARLGGDEFAVLHVGGHSGSEGPALARRLVAELSRPLDIMGRRLRVGASAGVAFSAGTGNALGVDQLLVQADMALYAAKEAGRGRHAVYASELGEMSHRRGTIEQGLRQAIERGELELHWQPKLEIGPWTIVGAEALLRWTHPALGRVGPAEFVAVAEQGGLIDELGRWALRQACRAAARELKGLTVSVNVSPLQLRDGAFVGHVRDALREFRLEPARLELEITESVFIEDAEAALEQLRALRGLGVRVALDDFGTGYSSLSYLRRFPFDTLKIDRAFVNEMLQQDDARAIVQMIANLAATLGMRTVCEGVETAEQLAAVGEAGCDEIQGYLISAPRPLADFVRLVRDWRQQPRPRPAQLH
jgi:diguanylate cyclase (GGDEF)-like protein